MLREFFRISAEVVIAAVGGLILGRGKGMGNELWEQMVAIKNKIEEENRDGGELKGLLCPFCGLPLCLRSDYVRCNRCGKNWWEGTDLTQSPHSKRVHTGSLIVSLENGTVAVSRLMVQKSSMSEVPELTEDEK